MSRFLVAASYLFLVAIVLGGCAKTVPVPVAMKREFLKAPAECDDRKDPSFPKVAVVKGAAVDPAASAALGVKASRWAGAMKHYRRVCGTYTRAIDKRRG